MKKITLILLSVVLCLSIFTGCNGGDDSGALQGIAGIDGYFYNTEFHWKKSDNSDKKEHQNDLGRCCCGMYYETDDLVYDLRIDNGGNKYYAVSEYKKYGNKLDVHIEIPAFHQESGDSNPIPVLVIDESVFEEKDILTIKLNEGLKTIGKNAFSYSPIKELIIPNSVTGTLSYLAVKCSSLRKVIIGSGVEVVGRACFQDCSNLQYVKVGSKVREIQFLSFYNCDSLGSLVIPKSVVSIPEYDHWQPKVDRYVSFNNLFQDCMKTPNIYLEITEAEYNALIIPKKERNPETGLTIDPKTGNDISPNTNLTTYGYVEGWCGFASIYYVGEWQYDNNGEPKPN